MINNQNHLKVNGPIEIKIDPKAIFKLMPNASTSPYIMRITNTSNVIVDGGIFIGDRNEHLGTTGEGGNAIAINRSMYVHIKNIQVFDCWGDGLAVWDDFPRNDTVISHDISFEHVVVKNCGRNSLALGGVHNIFITKSEFSGSNRVSPMAGIDIEPDGSQPAAYNIFIDSCTFRDNVEQGIVFGGGNSCHSISVNNCVFVNNKRCVNLAGSAHLLSKITVSKNIMELQRNGYGVLVGKSSSITIADNIINSIDNTATAFLIGANCSNLTFSKNQISNGNYAVYCESGSAPIDVIISENNIKASARPFSVEGSSWELTKNVINGTLTRSRLRLDNSLIANNSFYNTTVGAINLVCNNTSIVNNTFAKIATNEPTQSIIDLTLLENCFISNNYFDSQNPTQPVIWEGAVPTKVSVISNNFARYGSLSNLFKTKTGTIVTNNHTNG